MAKKMEFYEDAHERFEAGLKKVLAYKPSKNAEKLSKSQPEPVRKDLNRS